MEWRFTLIDRNDSRTIIDEPVGWDSFSIRIKRHPQRHGTFRELQGNTFQFHGRGGVLLKAEYEQYGINGNYRLLIEWKCGFAWTEFYTGTISFDSYSYSCGQNCYAEVDIEQTGPLVSFINRFDQKVDVDSAVAFDQATALSAYSTLTKNVVLPSKAIVLRAIARNTAPQEFLLNCTTDAGWYDCFGFLLGFRSGLINPIFNTVDVNSIKKATFQSIGDFHNISHFGEYTPEIIHNEPEQELDCLSTNYDIDFRLKGTYEHIGSDSGSHELNLFLKRGTISAQHPSGTLISGWVLVLAPLNIPNTYSFDVSYTGTVPLAPGEKLWLCFEVRYQRSSTSATGVKLTLTEDCRFKASVISKCAATPAKLYMINETASRITEAITDNKLKVYSQYLGRKDSFPYSFPAPGCGGIRALTNGLNIRRAKMADATDPKLFLSMQDVFNHLAATDNLGIGFEGTDKIRIEPWTFFYKNTIIHRCPNVDVVKKSIRENEHYSIFKNGYDKWETEDYNGQDEIHTKREFRTQITQTQNTLEQSSKILASGYAIETTRRKGPADKDWRYDNDVFAICLMNKIFSTGAQFIAFSSIIRVPYNQLYQIGFQSHTIEVFGTALNNGIYTVTSVSTFLNDILIQVVEPLVNETVDAVIEDISGHYAVELGNIESAANLIDPPTVYNFRISPIRMAMRWFNKIAALYRNITGTDKLIFSSGEGNYIAEGKMSTPECRLEAAVISEKSDINLSSFDDPESGHPINYLESVDFKYPLGAGDFKKIAANPNDLIEYDCDCEIGQGWIDELDYFPNEGTAKFLLIPKIPD
jgi:hypothetical protein